MELLLITDQWVGTGQMLWLLFRDSAVQQYSSPHVVQGITCCHTAVPWGFLLSNNYRVHCTAFGVAPLSANTRV